MSNPNYPSSSGSAGDPNYPASGGSAGDPQHPASAGSASDPQYGQTPNYGQSPDYGQGQNYGQTQDYGQSGQSQQYGQTQDYGQAQDYGQGQSYGQSGQSQQYGQTQDYGQGQQYQQQGYEQQGYQQQGYQQQGYDTSGYGANPYGAVVPYGAGKPVGDPGTLDLPWYGIGFGAAVKRAFQKYARFDGRASRGEFWWFTLFHALIGLVLLVPGYIILIAATVAASQDASSGSSSGLGAGAVIAVIFFILAGLYFLATIVPAIAVTWRRLHDANYTGLLYLLSLTSIGGIVVLVLTIMDSNPEGARYDRPGVGAQPQYYGQ